MRGLCNTKVIRGHVQKIICEDKFLRLTVGKYIKAQECQSKTEVIDFRGIPTNRAFAFFIEGWFVL